ncbi:hypothetical protein YA0002_25895, partial [Pseudomonas cichorii]|uniref:hypothetical protein n=1 Tax=Pseudomonas cichorii TaxID=36746 RepID=UPI0018E603E1
GDVDGLNLFRFSRNAPTSWVDPFGASPFNLSDVLDDLSKRGDPVEAIGLENITRLNPHFGGTLAVALSASRKGLAFARTKINLAISPFANTAHREKLLRHFRTESEASHDTDSDILNLLSNPIGKLASYLENWDDARMIMVGGDREHLQMAWQYTNDPEQHIFMREGIVHESVHRAAWNILHESSHTALGTKDFWYINTPGATSADAQGTASYSGRIGILAELQRLQFRNDTMIWDGPDVAVFDRAAFKDDALQRTRIALENADSIALLVSSINLQFNGPMARLAVLDEHSSSIPALDLATTKVSSRIELRRLSL